MNNTTRLATIDWLLRNVPTFTCRDGCADCCGPVVMSRLEMKRICERTGLTPKDLDYNRLMASKSLVCPLLDKETKRCTVYDIRPAVCRIFGASADYRLACPHGCKPAVPLTPKQTESLVGQIESLGHGMKW